MMGDLHPNTDAASEDDSAIRSARAFRAALTALSEPGRIVEIPSLAPAAFGPPPPPLSPAAATLLELLADPDAPYWLAPDQGGAEARKRFTFLCGAAPCDAPPEAHYLLGSWTALAPHLSALRGGTPERPDLSATLLVECRSLTGGRPRSVSGPGVPGARSIAPDLGVDAAQDAAFATFLSANAKRYPLGIDLYLCAEGAILGLPRTAVVTDAAAAAPDA